MMAENNMKKTSTDDFFYKYNQERKDIDIIQLDH